MAKAQAQPPQAGQRQDVICIHLAQQHFGVLGKAQLFQVGGGGDGGRQALGLGKVVVSKLQEFKTYAQAVGDVYGGTARWKLIETHD